MKRITSYQGEESNPHFSPNGKNIAFISQYDGNTDVFVMEIEWGEPKRITSDILRD